MPFSDAELSQLAERVRAALLEAKLVNEAASVALPAAAPYSVDTTSLAGYIDHTLLKPSATDVEIKALCREAREHRFASVCVNPGWVPLAAKELGGTGIRVCTVIGFPLGATTTRSKAFEARDAVDNGAHELDMVLNVGKLKSGDLAVVYQDVRNVVIASDGRLVKVILETSLLTDEEKAIACFLCAAAGAHFVKTSTGFGGGGATVEDIALMRRIVGPNAGVKASGGVRDAAAAVAMLKAGASRIGTSSSIAIATGAGKVGAY